MSKVTRAKDTRATRRDPAPSRWAWRMQRLMLTPLFRLGLRVGLPFVVTFGLGSWWLSQPQTHIWIEERVASIQSTIQDRPEFQVNLMAIDGADTPLAEAIRTALPLEFPMSSFDLELPQIRDTVMEFAAVKDADVRVRPGGVLQIDVMPRVPVAIWRTPDGLRLVDAEGVQISEIARRALKPELPLIAGEGAPAHVAEALALVRAATPLGDRLRGLVRLGDRRWDVVLDRDQRILLPETGAVQALERVIVLESTRDVLSRDVARVDLRLPSRPTVRMTDKATAEWWRIRALNTGNE